MKASPSAAWWNSRDVGPQRKRGKPMQRVFMTRMTIALCGLAFLRLAGADACAQSVEDFYRGKQIRFIIHSTPGGDYDMWARLLGRFMSKYVPGNPAFVPQNMPGAGGITAANTLFARAPRDGTA